MSPNGIDHAPRRISPAPVEIAGYITWSLITATSVSPSPLKSPVMCWAEETLAGMIVGLTMSAWPRRFAPRPYEMPWFWL